MMSLWVNFKVIYEVEVCVIIGVLIKIVVLEYL